MKPLIPIKIPLLNPNEPEALLVSLEAAEGEKVKRDQVIAVIETTKSTGEVLAGEDGYLVGLRFSTGDMLTAGEVLAHIGESPDAKDPALPPWGVQDGRSASGVQIDGLRITEPARELALESGLPLESLPQGPLVTREMVREMLLKEASGETRPVPEGEKRMVIYGAGGHGRSLAAMILTLGTFDLVGFLDDGYPPGDQVSGLPIFGGGDALAELAGDGFCLAVNGVGGIGDLESRLQVYSLLRQAGFHCPTLIQPTAFIEEGVILDEGVQMFPLAYIGTEVKVGFGTIVNTGAIVSHTCQLGDFVNLSPGATLAGDVIVAEGALVGMRATVNLGVRVGKRARIGNGATVKADVPDGGLVPAGSTWPPRR